MPSPALIESSYGTRSIIGVGEEAVVYQYHTGPHKGLVGRVQVRHPPFDILVSPKYVLHRFRSQQIAYSAFPQYNLDVVALDFNGKQIFSRRVKRSKMNKKDSTEQGMKERRQEYFSSKVNVELPQSAKEAANTMRKCGVYVNTSIANASVNRNDIKFFEVDSIKKELLPAGIDPNLISANNLELMLSREELHQFFVNEKFRKELLKTKDLENLADFYAKELVSTIILR